MMRDSPSDSVSIANCSKNVSAESGNASTAILISGQMSEEDDEMMRGPTQASSSYNEGPYLTAEEEFTAYELYCETDEPARDSSRSGYKGDLLDLRSGGVYGGMGVGMFWGQRHAKFPRLTEAAIRISGTPPSQALSERTFLSFSMLKLVSSIVSLGSIWRNVCMSKIRRRKEF